MDPIKDAFVKVKKDISLLRKDFDELKDSKKELKDFLISLNSKKVKKDFWDKVIDYLET